MTNQEKDLENAREYLEQNFPKNATIMILEPKSEKRSMDTFIELKQLLCLYVNSLESMGIIKFTANRNDPEGNIGK